MPHTTRGTNRRQKCRERGYYHLHRQLDHTLLFHDVLIRFEEKGKGS
jgi:hypothetical protein